ncbi:hypothetical protein [Actinoplanes sp. NPDC023714]|uniref:hypothetical protein n=1 Tax=Actinoplanes sp. NPDC023714 TaxID=3154322 RepID=UPI003403A96F
MSQPAEQFSTDDPQTDRSRIIDRVEHGEEIVISRRSTGCDGRPHQARRPEGAAGFLGRATRHG